MEWGTKIGIFFACCTLPLYISGLVPACVKAEDIQEYWRLSPAEFSAKAGTPIGPGVWISALGQSDNLAALPVLFFCVLPIVAYGAMFPGTIKSRDRLYALFMLAEIALIILAFIGFV